MKKKHTKVGTIKEGNRTLAVWVESELNNGKLSISGVTGPRSNGDAWGSCGQIINDLRAPEFTPLAGIDTTRLTGIWNEWHLNDMQAECEHQRRKWGPALKLQIEFTEHSIEWDVRRTFERDYVKQCRAHGAYKPGQARGDYKASVKYSPAGAVLWGLDTLGIKPFAWKALNDETLLARVLRQVKRYYADDLLAHCKTRTTTKHAGHLRPDEHPQGLLCKPCPDCGYKYGTAWLRKKVPADVIEWLEALPDDTESLCKRWR